MFNVDQKFIRIDSIIPYYRTYGFQVVADTNWSAYYPDLDRRAKIREFYQTFERTIDMDPDRKDYAIGIKVLADQLPFKAAIAPMICYIDKTSYYYPKGGKKVVGLLLAGVAESPTLVFTNQPILSQLEQSNKGLREYKQLMINSDRDLYQFMQTMNPMDTTFYVRIERRHAPFPMITYLETNDRLFGWKSEYKNTEEVLRKVRPKAPKVIALGDVKCTDSRIDFRCISFPPDDFSDVRDIKRAIESLISEADCVIFSKAAIDIEMSYIWLNSYNGHTKSMTRWGASNCNRPFDYDLDQLVLYKDGSVDGPIMAAPAR